MSLCALWSGMCGRSSPRMGEYFVFAGSSEEERSGAGYLLLRHRTPSIPRLLAYRLEAGGGAAVGEGDEMHPEIPLHDALGHVEAEADLEVALGSLGEAAVVAKDEEEGAHERRGEEPLNRARGGEQRRAREPREPMPHDRGFIGGRAWSASHVQRGRRSLQGCFLSLPALWGSPERALSRHGQTGTDTGVYSRGGEGDSPPRESHSAATPE